MLTLGELCDLVDGRVTMLIELKSRFDGDERLPARVAAVLVGYRGHVSADVVRSGTDRGACGTKRHNYPAASLPPNTGRIHIGIRCHFGCVMEWVICVTGLAARAQFVAYAVADLPALAPFVARHIFGLPLLTWAVRTEAERRIAARFADQMIFEGFRP